MIKTTAINLVNPEPMMVTWDTGRRCNYDVHTVNLLDTTISAHFTKSTS